jgi:hypothetical protein
MPNQAQSYLTLDPSHKKSLSKALNRIQLQNTQVIWVEQDSPIARRVAAQLQDLPDIIFKRIESVSTLRVVGRPSLIVAPVSELPAVAALIESKQREPFYFFLYGECPQDHAKAFNKLQRVSLITSDYDEIAE